MKKLLYLLLILFLGIGCTHKKHGMPTLEDSIVTVYGFGDLPNDSCIRMPYKEFVSSKGSYIAIYDIPSNQTEFVRYHRYKYGDWKLDSLGDTIFCADEDLDIFVSAEEWHKYCEQYMGK